MSVSGSIAKPDEDPAAPGKTPPPTAASGAEVHGTQEAEAEQAQAASTLRARVVAAVVLAILADGCSAAISMRRSHAGFGTVLLSGLESSAFLALPLTLAVLPLAWFLARPSVRILGRHVRLGLAAGQADNGDLAVILYMAALGAGIAWANWNGYWLAEQASIRVGLLAMLAFMVFWVFAAMVLVSAIVGKLGSFVTRVGAKVPWLPRPTELILAVAGVLTILRLLPVSHAVTPAWAIVGFAMGPTLKARISVLSGPRRPLPWAAYVAVAAAASTLAALTLSRVPEAVQLGVLYRAPYSSLLIAAAHKLVDRDHDGYSPILLGGDCNDHDPRIHPGAFDFPDDGIDQNCSGADTHAYHPAVQPPEAYVAPLPKHPNIILVQLDATRPDHIGFAGYKRSTTPNLDKFRQTATWFKDAYTPAPTTRFAMAALFTGLDIDRIPQRRGPGINFFLLLSAVTFAERLESIGYDRVGYTISYVMQHHVDTGQGFRIWKSPWPVDDWEKTYVNAAELTTDAGLSYIKSMPEDGSKPYLLMLHYQCTHDPYIKHAQWDFGDSDLDRYDSAMAYCDDNLGKLFSAIDARADKDQTAIFVFSDHGELFGEHGLTNHGNSLYQPDVRILLLARLPGGKVRTVEDPILLTDITPTILELAGLPKDPASHAWSLVPYALNVPATPRPKRDMFLYADLWRGNVHYEARGVVDGDYKYIHDLGTGINELYNLSQDPEELTNLVEAAPALRGRLSEMLDSWETYERSVSGVVSAPGMGYHPPRGEGFPPGGVQPPGFTQPPGVFQPHEAVPRDHRGPPGD
jgi:arylsulfatase A-like enzyme